MSSYERTAGVCVKRMNCFYCPDFGPGTQKLVIAFWSSADGFSAVATSLMSLAKLFSKEEGLVSFCAGSVAQSAPPGVTTALNKLGAKTLHTVLHDV